MTRIGVTGHIHLEPLAHRLIRDELVRVLSAHPRVHGVTCLAEGADQLFARAVRECGGTFEVILPVPLSAGPAEMPPAGLLGQARRVSRIAVGGPVEAAYEAASRAVVDRTDILIAVWDGEVCGARGGTAETVAWALRRGREVLRVWPDGARRLTVAVA
ncbi:hypothetical protein [Actinoplanes sp. G11-F43]|uniref:hypothetical protein n=1 Tax=Actinoplanes sp. G11-F43 TaxID=3424130 RepID=UPI003D33F3FF